MTETCGAMQREKFTNSVALSLNRQQRTEPSDNDTVFDGKNKSITNSLPEVYTYIRSSKLQEFQRHANTKFCCFVIVLLGYTDD